MTKIIAIVQARMGSRRFPGKVLEELHGKPNIQFILETLEILKKDHTIDDFIVATPNTEKNKKLWNFLSKLAIKIFKGSDEDVLDRYFKCAKENKADIIVRISADNPLIERWQIKQQIENYKKFNKFTYGNGAWVFSIDELEESWNNGHHEEDREHVVTRMYKTIDYPEDLERLRKLFINKDYRKIKN